MAVEIRRCAIYTRKSSEEGLELDFNSLHAQREACEAFIRSQRSEGWRLVDTPYDDPGISGGTMERPALQQLLADIEEGVVDTIVVYKVDRLTRSLTDFSKMVEVFDRKGVSFVAVTQQFNTTTSMGRLTLNVLLSFAQFEREVAGERIRDKIAASKRKGIWMGGSLPRGYRVEDRKLLVVPEEAEVVRRIFRLYLSSTSIRDLACTLRRLGIRSRFRSGAMGPISRGALYATLRNPIYIGMIAQQGELFPGQHEGIIDRSVWDAAQEKLKAGAQPSKTRLTETSPLKGKLFDEEGELLTPSHTAKEGRRYRYYVSHSDDVDLAKVNGTGHARWRLPAREIESQVQGVVDDILADGAAIARAAVEAGQSASVTKEALDQVVSNTLGLVERVDLQLDGVRVTLVLPGPEPIRLERSFAFEMKRRGCERRLVIEGSGPAKGRADPMILLALKRGLRFWAQINSEDPKSALAFAKAEGVDNRYLGRALQLTFLAPDILEALAAGRQPVDFSVNHLFKLDPLPLSWADQRRALGIV